MGYQHISNAAGLKEVLLSIAVRYGPVTLCSPLLPT